MTIKIIDIINNVGGQGQGVTVKFGVLPDATKGVVGMGSALVVGGYRYEAWHTPNGSGNDFYIGNTDEPWDPNDLGEAAGGVLIDYLDAVIDQYWKAYEEYVNPVIQAAVDHVIAKADNLLHDNYPVLAR